MLTRVLTLVIVVTASHALARDPRVERLPEPARVWLEEEVVYIITEREREAFVSLATDEERKYFVDAFWSKRDPNPVTPANEFRDEHYRRLAYANTKLNAESLLPGWKTERGRMHIILGEPRSIEHYNMDNKLVTSEHWFYEGDTKKGLPAFFNLIFFKRMDTGEFRLYSPSADGPSALVRGRFAAQPQVAIETINRVSPELARAALSIEARAGGDIHSGIASLENETTMMRIESSPTHAIRTDYLDGWERYGARVAAEYSFNFVSSRSVFVVIPARDGTPFLHYSIELDPENFSVETTDDGDQSQSKFYTTLDVTVELRDADGTLIVADDKETYIELTPSQLESIRMTPVAYQDSFPVLPGEYTVNVIVRNRVHFRFTAAEHELTVPAFPTGVAALSDIALGHLVETTPAPTTGDGLRTFQMGELRVHPAADGVFTQNDWLQTFFRVVGAGAAQRLRFRVVDGEHVVSAREARVASYPGGVVNEPFALSGMASGYYRLVVELIDENGAPTVHGDVPFQISPRSAIPRPNFIARRHFPSEEPGRVAYALAEQLMALGRLERAVHELEIAVAAHNPNLPMARWKLAGAYNRMSQPERALELLLPMAQAYAGEFDVAMGLGVAFYIKEEFDNAVPHFERAMTIRPPNASQLNALGNCYVRIGRVDDAKVVYRHSLELDSSQESVTRALAALGKTASPTKE